MVYQRVEEFAQTREVFHSLLNFLHNILLEQLNRSHLVCRFSLVGVSWVKLFCTVFMVCLSSSIPFVVCFMQVRKLSIFVG